MLHKHCKFREPDLFNAACVFVVVRVCCELLNSNTAANKRHLRIMAHTAWKSLRQRHWSRACVWSSDCPMKCSDCPLSNDPPVALSSTNCPPLRYVKRSQYECLEDATGLRWCRPTDRQTNRQTETGRENKCVYVKLFLISLSPSYMKGCCLRLYGVLTFSPRTITQCTSLALNPGCSWRESLWVHVVIRKCAPFFTCLAKNVFITSASTLAAVFSSIYSF